MASHANLDDDDDFGGDFPGSHSTMHSGNKRSFGDLEDDEDDIFGSKKANSKVEENCSWCSNGDDLSLRESLQNCKDTLAKCQLQNPRFRNGILHFRMSPSYQLEYPASVEPKLVINHLQTLKSSEETLKEQLEKAKKKEAAFIVTFAKREQEIAELKVTSVVCTCAFPSFDYHPMACNTDISFDFQSAVRDLKGQLKPPSMQARRLLLDPAIHEEFTHLKAIEGYVILLFVMKNLGALTQGGFFDVIMLELEMYAIMQSNVFWIRNIAAVGFTPQSKMGKMLMAKCRTLQEENEEIGTQAEEGSTIQTNGGTDK
ncbi:short-chain dehydrogenase TIC 32 [Hibiscus syriacus]|uniref:Short-chain dehydrogenase TIC 32 n=1 Tax=Hibiscus syriacus TaxID=106335 RepID=A0A6A2ZRP9_HIBSY|nr:short-chain dehydrogenase TIC 32 [Hibiscus syriacus]